MIIVTVKESVVVSVVIAGWAWPVSNWCEYAAAGRSMKEFCDLQDTLEDEKSNLSSEERQAKAIGKLSAG